MGGVREDKVMTQFGMVIDVDRCIGCYLCFLACRDEHVGNDNRPIAAAQPESGQKWIDVREHERGALPRVKVDYVPVLCMQCADAPCIRAATGGAVHAASGRHRRHRSRQGRRPARHRRRLPVPPRVLERGGGGGAEVHLLRPSARCRLERTARCVEACPTRALVFGDLADPDSDIAKLKATRSVEDFHAGFASRPAVGYLGLPKRFVAGEIAFADKLHEPAAGVDVALDLGGSTRMSTTDGYGDFEFADVAAKAVCRLRVTHPGYVARELVLSSRPDLDVGTIVLDPLPSR